MNRLLVLLSGTMLTAALLSVPALAQEGAAPATGNENTQSGEPVETKPANAPDQQPAFAGQTRAPQPAETVEIETEVVAQDLPHLWAMEFLPDGRMLVNAKQGAMHIVSAEGEAGPALEGVPEVLSDGQGGLLDVALAPDFESSGMIFFSFSEQRDHGNGTSVASAKLVTDDQGGGTLEDVQVIFRQTPSYDGNKHFGSRLVFGPNDELYVTVGERSDPEPRVQAQDLSSGLGKIFRIDRNGEPLPDNPFVGQENAQPEIWSLGHRNLQSATLDGQGRLWTVEHGPRGGDELNRPEPGKNYGWPEVTYGLEYSGDPVGEGITQQAETEQPVYYWDPVIAPSGMAYYDGDAIPEWQGAFLIGGLVSQGIVVVHMDGDRVQYEERVPLNARIRDVKVGPDGAVYAVTEQRGGGGSTIVKLTKAG
ncbi:Soluble aldose sugar dehydrogenase yliI [Pseudorhizobium banfieldiae]|uniref:Soluble aldose sugar dehydrogenase yliI n=1 Tax=Pseudorhizobium banfieldiae TaxID=1125847 RepID=L0NGL8_9HYPH|nr:PQQ-dependent sugar dehydrogenase [Pseudorhizobium banfieldiae]CAD6614268.1 PQQ-dependent sugar dehydrogenase [arsenite-oxidising bacterium NT-25]CCF20029.1 Soluble aldose sugar dehydrogenase yliI [Pseudorhizobium banfieldiae]